jgi:anti-anti-sigma regulatory factor
MGLAMLRIEKISAGTKTILRLSGRIQTEHLSALQEQCEQIDTMLILDLRETQLVDEAAVRFLAKCESEGVVLRHCPGYIAEWIRREHESE